MEYEGRRDPGYRLLELAAVESLAQVLPQLPAQQVNLRQDDQSVQVFKEKCSVNTSFLVVYTSHNFY